MAASGMDVQQARIEGTANNLANAATPGFKKERFLIKSFPEQLLIEKGGPQDRRSLLLPRSRRIGTSGIGARLAEASVDFTPGVMRETGNKTDLFLKGPGFFAVNAPVQEDPERVCYTRNGAFKIDAEGYLATSSGYRVLGESGEIRLDAGSNFKVDPDGSIKVDGVQVEKIRLVEFSDNAVLSKEAGDIFTGEGMVENTSATTVYQGFLEVSNVNVADEIVDLISATRAYEAGQRLIQSQDELLAKAVNQVGSLRQ